MQVVGDSATNANQPFFWQSGSPPQFFGSTGGDAYAINDSGQVVGDSDASAYIWQSGGALQMIAPAGLVDSYARGINDAGQVAETAATASGVNQAFLWQSGSGAQGLGFLPGGTQSFAEAVNLSAQVVGQAVASNGHYDAFLWQAGSGMQDLGALGGTGSEAIAISNAGQVVGLASTSSGSRAFLWQSSGGMQDLNSLIAPASGWTLQVANAINNEGQIVGYGTDPGGAREAYLLTPALRGDANLDGKVDVNDLTIVLSHFGQSGTTWAQGEFTGDGTVDVNDLTIVLANYGSSLGSAAAGMTRAPEPGTLSLLAAGLAGLLVCAQRKRK